MKGIRQHRVGLLPAILFLRWFSELGKVIRQGPLDESWELNEHLPVNSDMHRHVEDRSSQDTAHSCALLAEHTRNIRFPLFIRVHVQAGRLWAVNFVNEESTLGP